VSRTAERQVSFADWELVRQGLCLEPLLQAISDFLDGQKDMIEQVRCDLTRGLKKAETGRNGLTPQQVLRSLVLMRVKNWNYRELRERIADGCTLRQFADFYCLPVPRHDAFHRGFNRLTPETLKAINDLVVQAAVHKMTLEQWNAVINTNLGSLFNMTRQVIEGMRARKFGRVINISSINGQKGQFGQVNYSAAKAGDIGFTKALALENAKGGITVNAICRGYINTEMVQAVPKEVLEKSILPLIPVNRLGEPEEIARAVVFLAAEDAGFITGSTLTMNGGQYMV
jgi:NAD(P)-dependent dehydrogenase (short-subunit alcohol dehydrogenase family)